MTAEEIIRLIALGGSLLVSLIGFLIALIKDIKLKKWDDLKTALIGFIAKAEEFTSFSGQEKKEAVLTWASDFCKSHGLKFDKDKISGEIEELIALTKSVNAK